MGRDDVMMDNGKKAQGAMALYWKKQKTLERKKDRGPRPVSAVEPDEDKGDDLTGAVDKWKNHKLDMQMKKYDHREEHRQQKGADIEQTEEPKPKEYSHDVLVKKLEDRELKIPGYGKAHTLHKRLNVIQAPKIKPQQPSSSGIPDELKDLFGSEAELQKILQLNKHKKKLKNLAKEKERADRVIIVQNRVPEDPFQKTLDDEHYDPLKKDKQDSEHEEPKQEPKLFKSDILNKLAEGTKLEVVVHKVQTVKLIPQIQAPEHVEQKQPSKKPLFIPRSVAQKKN